MSVFEQDAYKMAKSEEPQSVSQYSPFEDSQLTTLTTLTVACTRRYPRL